MNDTVTDELFTFTLSYLLTLKAVTIIDELALNIVRVVVERIALSHVLNYNVREVVIVYPVVSIQEGRLSVNLSIIWIEEIQCSQCITDTEQGPLSNIARDSIQDDIIVLEFLLGQFFILHNLKGLVGNLL
jgi:hypothetical protein